MGDLYRAMMRAVLSFSVFLSVIFFPWPLTALFALVAAFLEPLVPLAAGIFADTLYYSSSAQTLPLFTVCGLAATGIALFVHSRLKASIIGG